MRGLFPGALWRPVRFTGKTGLISATPRGWLLHVAEMNGSPWHVFDSSMPGKRKVSTGWVGKDGSVEQYISRYDKPWAQDEGNADYWAFETEGYATEPLTANQIRSLAQIHNWLEAADNVIDVPGALGVGTHVMGGKAWGGHACPGAARAAQRKTIIAVAQSMRNGEDMPISDADAAKIADVNATRYQVHSPHNGVLVTRDAALGAVWDAVLDLKDVQTQILARLDAQAPGSQK